MAEAFAKMMNNPNITAFSAGSSPSGKINPTAIESMQSLGYNLSNHSSKSVNDFLDENFDVVVGMGCGDKCPYLKTKKRIDWDIPDPKNLPLNEFNKIRDLIQSKVKDLLSAF